ncbi:MAG TPA: hypothetical protein PLF13_04035 [candidate division Zixibacteria bacterium]|nr:hypothetical protein [candidate division Zixibacteria bacterium]
MTSSFSKLIAVIILAVLALGCGGEQGPPDPKKTVIKLFGAMEKDDKAALTYVLDLPELMKSFNADYALDTENPRVFHNPEEILDDLTGDGQTKTTWFKYQRIINQANIMGEETASVDVTFVDKAQSRGYRARFGLHLVNGKWKIYSFNTIQGR